MAVATRVELVVVSADAAGLGSLVGSAGVGRDVHPDHSDRARRPHDLDHVVEYQLGVLDPADIVSLMASTGSLSEMSTGSAPMLSARPRRSFFLSTTNTRWAPRMNAVCGQQADRPGAKHRDVVVGADLRQLCAVAPGRENVRQHREIELLLCSLRQLESAGRDLPARSTRILRG